MPRRHKYKQEKLMTKLLKQKEKQATKKVKNKTSKKCKCKTKCTIYRSDRKRWYPELRYCGVCNGYYYDYDSDDNDWWGCQTFFHEKRTGIWKQIRFETFYEWKLQIRRKSLKHWQKKMLNFWKKKKVIRAWKKFFFPGMQVRFPTIFLCISLFEIPKVSFKYQNFPGRSFPTFSQHARYTSN